MVEKAKSVSEETDPVIEQERLADLDAEINEYIAANWENILRNLESLVKIPSVEEPDAATPGVPFGPGPKAALDCVLEMAREMGFDAHNVDGYIGYADYPGETATQVGVIGHVDVVPAGPGWTVEPYALTRRDGYLLGRGTSDDKGPLVVAMYAAKFLHEKLASQGKRPRYTIRLLFGANEETNMADVAYYRERFDDPAFLFTPDAEFPLGYGESGCCVGELTGPVGGSAKPTDGEGAIVKIWGGAATNAVPGEAHALLRLPEEKSSAVFGETVPGLGGVDVGNKACAADRSTAANGGTRASVNVAPGVFATLQDDGFVLLDAVGKSAHASTPDLGKNAIALLVDYLLAVDLCAPAEKSFLQLEGDLLNDTSGKSVGIDARDQHFGDLTAVGGMVSMRDGRIVQTLDCRYPTTTSAQEIESKLASHAQSVHADFRITHDKKPFLMNPESDAVSALISAFNHVTGRDAKPFTMKGGTYARMFDHAVSFGPEVPGEVTPDWVGGMHSPDEGIGEESLKRAFRVYVHALDALMRVDL